MAADSNASGDDQNNEKKDYTTPIVITVLIVFLSVAITVFLILQRRIRSNRRPGKTSHTDENQEEQNSK